MWVNIRNEEGVEVLSIAELYEWAMENGCADCPIRYTDGGQWALVSEIEDLCYPAYLDSPVVGVIGFTV